MQNTVIYVEWLHDVQWLDGWNSLNSTEHMRYPCIWVTDPTASATQLMPQGPGLLNEEEQKRALSFRQAAHQVRFQTSHTVLRLLMARATAVKASEIRFGKEQHNKPKLLTPTGTSWGFNLSYTENRIMIGLHDKLPIGIDIEWMKRPFDFEVMLQACFSEREINFIMCREESMKLRFFTLWTRKEAVLKLTGEGINDQLPAFEVLDGINHAKKHIIGGQPPDALYLYSVQIGSDYLACIALPKPLKKLWCYHL